MPSTGHGGWARGWSASLLPLSCVALLLLLSLLLAGLGSEGQARRSGGTAGVWWSASLMHRRCINWTQWSSSVPLRRWKGMEASLLRSFNKRLAGVSSIWTDYCAATPSPACRGGEGGTCGPQFFSSSIGLDGQLPRSATSPASLPAKTLADGQPLCFESAILAAVSKRRGTSAAATIGLQIGDDPQV
jgi:hypothetical protein